MKKSILLITIFLCAVVCIAPACKKKTEDPISQLPAATQTGANTFGALVNGEAFTPHSNLFGAAPYQCNYIYLNGGYYLTVAGNNKTGDNSATQIIIGTTNLPIAQGQTYKLDSYNVSGKAFGEYSSFTTSNSGVFSALYYNTTTTIAGQLYISHFDPTNQIVSGTFFFDAVDPSGDVIHVTDGRFDMKYTQ